MRSSAVDCREWRGDECLLGKPPPEGADRPERQSQSNRLCKPLMLLSYAVRRHSVWRCVCSASATCFQLDVGSRSVSRETVADSRDGTPR